MSNVRETPQPVEEYIILLARVAVMNVAEPAHCTVTQEALGLGRVKGRQCGRGEHLKQFDFSSF